MNLFVSENRTDLLYRSILCSDSKPNTLNSKLLFFCCVKSTSGATMTQMLVVTQPLPVMDLQDSQEWSSGICDCCENVPECCFAYWCFPCFACRTSREYGEHLCLPLSEYLGFAFPAITMSMRVSMRQRYGIHGTMCRDCALSCFCGPCSWCQMSREMKKRKIPVVLVSKNFS